MWWLSSLWSALRRTDDGDRPALIAVGGTLVLVVFLLAAAAVNAMIAVEKRNLGPEVTAAFYTLQVFLGNGGMFGLAAMVGATSAVGLRSKLLPQWLAWSGSVLAAAWVGAGLGIAYTRDALVYLGFVVFVAWLVWMLAVSAVLYRLPDTATDADIGTDAAR